MGAGLQRVVTDAKDEVSPRAANAGAPHAHALVDEAPVEFAPIRVPWHVRHSRSIVVAAVIAVVVGAAYGAFHVWQLFADPLGQLAGSAARAQPSAPVPEPVVLQPAPVATNPPTAAPKRAAPKAVATAPAKTPAMGRVTHTRPDEPAPVATVPAAAASAPPRGCAEGVAALGLCPAAATSVPAKGTDR
jgi:hypothetical protein